MKKSLATAGLTASLIGGGLVGAVAFAPTLANAQTDVGVETDDDTDQTHPFAGERFEEILAPLVDDGTIDQAQADAVVDAIVDARPVRDHPGRAGRGHGHLGAHGGAHLDELAESIGIDADTWRQGLADGQTPGEIAAANGSSAEELIEVLVAKAEERLDAAVENGRLDTDDAAERLAEITDRITARVNGEDPVFGR